MAATASPERVGEPHEQRVWGSGVRTANRLHVAIATGGERLDVSVSPDALVDEVLRAHRVDPGSARVVSSSGAVYDGDRPIGEQAGDGDVLWVVSTGSPAGEVRAPRRQAAPARRRTAVGASGWLACVGASGLCAVLVATHALAVQQGAGMLPTAVRLGIAALLGASALVLAVRRTGDQGGRPVGGSHLLDETILAPVTGFAAAFLTAPPELYGAVRLGVVVGLVAGGAVAALRYGICRSQQDPAEAVAGVLAVVWVGVALLFATTFLAGAPAHVAPCLVLGAVPLMMRALPSASLDVPDSQLLDLPFVMRTASSVRGRPPRSPGRVLWRQVESAVRFAERRRSAGLAAAAALVVVMAPSVLSAYEPGVPTGWATLALLGFLVVVLGLGPRSYRGIIAKAAPRVALAVLLLQVALAARAAQSGELWGLLTVAVALGVASVSLALVRGWRSVRWSRTGDIVEGIAVVLVMPAALVAAGAVDRLQVLVAG